MDLLKLSILLYFIKGEARKLSDAQILQCLLLSKSWARKEERDITDHESKL